jgi:hypothetical protein
MVRRARGGGGAWLIAVGTIGGVFALVQSAAGCGDELTLSQDQDDGGGTNNGEGGSTPSLPDGAQPPTNGGEGGSEASTSNGRGTVTCSPQGECAVGQVCCVTPDNLGTCGGVCASGAVTVRCDEEADCLRGGEKCRFQAVGGGATVECALVVGPGAAVVCKTDSDCVGRSCQPATCNKITLRTCGGVCS